MPKGQKIDNEMKSKVRVSYALTNSYNKTAKELGISDHTVKKIIKEDPEEYTKIYEQKKEEFADKASRLIDKAMNKLEKALDKEDIPINNLTTTIGTLYDKRALAKGESTGNNTFKVKIEVVK